MAFQITKTSVVQSALLRASELTTALIAAGDEEAKSDTLGTFDGFADHILERLEAVADADNEMLKEEAKKSGGSGGSRSVGKSRSGGSGKRGRSGGSGVDAEEAGETELTWGAFNGLTVAEIYELSEEDAEEYGYDGSGRKYINWLAKNKQNDYMAKRAKAFLKAKRDSEDDD